MRTPACDLPQSFRTRKGTQHLSPLTSQKDLPSKRDTSESTVVVVVAVAAAGGGGGTGGEGERGGVVVQKQGFGRRCSRNKNCGHPPPFATMVRKGFPREREVLNSFVGFRLQISESRKGAVLVSPLCFLLFYCLLRSFIVTFTCVDFAFAAFCMSFLRSLLVSSFVRVVLIIS